MKQALITLTAAAALLAGASSAHATLLDVDGLMNGEYGVVNVDYNGTSQNVYAGPFATHLDGGATFDSYCVDLSHDIGLPTNYQVAVTTTAYLTNGAWAARAYNKYHTLVDDSDSGVALQVALWTIVADNGQFNSGPLSVGGLDQNAYNQVQAILADPLTGISSKAGYYVATDHGPNGNINQNLIGSVTNASAVPEPCSLAALGLGALGLIRRKRK